MWSFQNQKLNNLMNEDVELIFTMIEEVTKVVVVFFLIDIVYKFNLAYHDLYDVVYDRIKIFKRYFTVKNFWFDLVISYPWYFHINEDIHPFYKGFLRLFRMSRIIRVREARKVYQQVKNVVVKNKNWEIYTRIFKTILIIVISGHWGACLFHFIGNYSVWHWFFLLILRP